MASQIRRHAPERQDMLNRQQRDTPHTQQRLLPIQTLIPQPRRRTLLPRRRAPRHVNATYHLSTPKRPHPFHLPNHVKRDGFSLRSRDRRHLHQHPRSHPNTHLIQRTRAIQPATTIQVDNSTTNGFANDTIKQKRPKAINTRFYWIRDRTSQGQFLIYWQPSIKNLGDYHTKHH